MSTTDPRTRRSFFRRFLASVLGGAVVGGGAVRHASGGIPSGAESSQPVDPFIGEITMFAGNFAPRGWAFCHGQLLSIAQNSALFSLLGTYYGGDGRTTFGLPDLRGRVPLGVGQGPGLTNHQVGRRGGSETNTLTTAQLPSHTHRASAKALGSDGSASSPEGRYWAANSRAFSGAHDSILAEDAVEVAPSGGSQAVNNLQPYLAINYIIALQGTYPSRS